MAACTQNAKGRSIPKLSYRTMNDGPRCNRRFTRAPLSEYREALLASEDGRDLGHWCRRGDATHLGAEAHPFRKERGKGWGTRSIKL
jgi:hypothetical protein